MMESIGMIHGICSLGEAAQGLRQAIGKLPGFIVYLYVILYIDSKDMMCY